MHKTREILRQKWKLGRSHREVSRSLGLSVGLVSATLGRARAAGLASFESCAALSDTELEARLYGPGRRPAVRPRPDPVWIHTERQRKGVTLELLHHEYLEQHPDGYRYTQFCAHNETFFSLAELNERIGALLEGVNAKVMRGYGQSRRERFLQIDRPALRPLPSEPYELAEWKHAKVNLDYHVELERHFYSVPHPLVHERVELRFGAESVEILHKGQRVAVHRRDPIPGGYTTVAAHMPKAHQKHLAWTPTRLVRWADSIGPETATLVAAILADRPHPEQGYRSCLGILRLAKQYGAERLEAACRRGVAVRARSYRHVQSILKHGLDRMPMDNSDDDESQTRLPLEHENVRGGDYYH